MYNQEKIHGTVVSTRDSLCRLQFFPRRRLCTIILLSQPSAHSGGKPWGSPCPAGAQPCAGLVVNDLKSGHQCGGFRPRTFQDRFYYVHGFYLIHSPNTYWTPPVCKALCWKQNRKDLWWYRIYNLIETVKSSKLPHNYKLWQSIWRQRVSKRDS